MKANKNISIKLLKIGQLIIALIIVAVLTITAVYGLSDVKFYVVNEAMDILSLFIILIIYSGFLRDKSINADSESAISAFCCVLFLVAMGLATDFLAWMVQGLPEYRVVNEITNHIYYLVGPSTLMAYWIYCVDLTQTENTPFYKKVYLLQGIVYAGAILAALLNIFFGFYFTVGRDGVYQRTEGSFIINAIFNFIMMIITVTLIVKSSSSRRDKTILIIMGIAPIIASIIQIIYFGVSVLFTLNALLSMIIYSYIHYQRTEKMVQQKIKIMQAQLQPHFIYNGMISIRTLIKKSPADAVAAMDHFIGYLRGSIEMFGKETLVSITDELQFAVDYLEIEKTRFGGKIDYEVINETDDIFLVPPISIQPLVENSVRHGIRQSESGMGKVTIHLYRDSKNYVIEIKDAGVGFDPDAVANDERIHVGISNTESRIRMLLGGELTVESTIGLGTTVKIVIPRHK